MCPALLTPDALARDLSCRDLTDPVEGPHAIQVLVDIAMQALGEAWGCDVRLTRGPRIVTGETRAEMKKILDEIQTGAFAKEWILENQANRPVFNALRRQSAEHPIEAVGAQLRSMMPWIGAGKAKPREVSGG